MGKQAVRKEGNRTGVKRERGMEMRERERGERREVGERKRGCKGKEGWRESPEERPER